MPGLCFLVTRRPPQFALIKKCGCDHGAPILIFGNASSAGSAQHDPHVVGPNGNLLDLPVWPHLLGPGSAASLTRSIESSNPSCRFGPGQQGRQRPSWLGALLSSLCMSCGSAAPLCRQGRGRSISGLLQLAIVVQRQRQQHISLALQPDEIERLTKSKRLDVQSSMA